MREEERFRLEEFLPYRLSVALNRVSRAFARCYAEEFGLSIPEWRVMAVLGSHAPTTANAVADRTAMDKVKVSRAVGRLLAGGLLRQTVDPQDQRQRLLDFTRRGRAVFQAIVPRALDLEARLLAGLGEAERRVLLATLDSLAERAADLGGRGGPTAD